MNKKSFLNLEWSDTAGRNTYLVFFFPNRENTKTGCVLDQFAQFGGFFCTSMNEMRWGVVCCALVVLVSLVAGDAISAANGAAKNVFEVINGRGQFPEIQKIVTEQIVTNSYLDGNVEAASVASSIEALIRPKRETLEAMRDCILANNSVGSETATTFSFHGFYGSEGWDRTKEENVLDSECLSSVWEQSATGTTVLQTFLGSSGFIRGFFTDTTLNSEISFEDDSVADARTNPDYVFSTTFQKQIVIILDFSDSSDDFIDAMKVGSNAVIQGLSDLDSVQVITSVPGFEKGFSCGGSGLLRATESNKKVLMEYVDSLSSPGPDDPSHLVLLELFSAAFNMTPVAGSPSSCQPLFLYVSANQFTKGNVKLIATMNKEYGVRIFTFAIQSATDSEGYLGGGSMYHLACENDGSWYNIQTPLDVPNKMIQYQMILQRSRSIVEPTWRVSFPSFGELTGLVVSGMLPVLSPSDPKSVIGVVTIQFTFNEIQDYLVSLKKGLSFVFLTTWNADLLIHPIYRDPAVVSTLPLFYDVSQVENSENFINNVRGALVTQRAGEKSVLVDRPLPRGDTGSVGYSTLPVNTSFFWTRLASLPFTVVLAYTEAQLRDPVFTSNNNTGWSMTSKIPRIFNEPDVADYVPPDYFETLTDTPRFFQESRSYVHTRDSWRNYNRRLAQEARSELTPSGIFNENNILEQPDSVKAIQTYLNNLNTSFIENPGFLADFRAVARIGSQFFERWREDSSSGLDVDGMFRFTGFFTDSSVTFPARVGLPSDSSFYVSQRPWYQKAESSPYVAALSTPYSDISLGTKVSTISQAVLENPEENLENILLFAVLGIDYPYLAFHQGFVDSTGCAYDREDAMNTGLPLCYLMDNSGLLVMSPDFLTPDFNTYDRTNSDILPVGVAEPQLALDLLAKGVLNRNIFINFRGERTELVLNSEGEAEGIIVHPIDTPQQVPQYSVNETVLKEAGGSVSGILEKVDGYCTSGTYTIIKIEGTNSYLLYIENYSLDNNEDCRVFDLDQVENITFGTCEENAKNYSQYFPACPKADERASTTEANRLDDSLCDLEPPKEADFVAWEDAAAIAMVAVASFLIIVTLILWGVVHKYRNTPVILLASPVFVSLQFFGFILGYMNIFLWTGEPTNVQCGLRPWIASISFVLIVGPMFAKTYRIWKLFCGKGFFARKMSDMHVLTYVGEMMVIPLIICIIWSAYEMPEPTYNDDDFDDDKRTYRCDGDSCRIFEGILIGYCGCLLALGSFFAFQSRKGSSYFNEARFIGVSIYIISFTGVVGVVLTYVLLGLPIAYYLVFCVSVMFAIFCTTLVVYSPKIRICLFKPEKNIYKTSSKGSGSVTLTSTMMDA